MTFNHRILPDCDECGERADRHIQIMTFGHGPGAYPQRHFCTYRCLWDWVTWRLNQEEGAEDTEELRFDREVDERRSRASEASKST